jgi:hypoxanthine phosphoribosyltransferase
MTKNILYAHENITLLSWSSFYSRIEDVASALIHQKYDHIFFIMRGGMSVAHRLAHILGCESGGFDLSPIYIQRHISDEIHAKTIDPVLKEPLDRTKIISKRILLVDDTVGGGATIQCAMKEIMSHNPSSVDVFSVGLDHSCSSEWVHNGATDILDKIVTCYDYWGWFVFPWERGAISEPPKTQFNNIEQSKSMLEREAFLRTVKINGIAYGKYLKKSFFGSIEFEVNTNLVELSYSSESPTSHFLNNFKPFKGIHNIFGIDLFVESSQEKLASINAVIAIGLFPSLLGCSFWCRALCEINAILIDGGVVVFDYLSRERVISINDVNPSCQFFSSDNIEKLMFSHGFIPEKNSHLECLSAQRSPICFNQFKKIRGLYRQEI